MKFRALPEANQDAVASGLWYDEQQTDLGGRFAASLNDAFKAIHSHPHRHPRVPKYRGRLELRQMLLVGFPYFVVYLRRDDEIVVVAVSHAKRRPFFWLRRLEDI